MFLWTGFRKIFFGGEDMFSSSSSQERLWDPLSFLQNYFPPGGKNVGLTTPPPNAEVKNTWSHTTSDL